MGVLWICGTLTTTFLQTEHFSSHQRSSLSNYRANELHPNYPQGLSSTAACQVISVSAIASLLTGSIVKHCVVDSLTTVFRSQLATHHSRFHGSDCLILGVMRHIGGTMEQIINSVSSVCSYRRAAVCPSNRFTGNCHVSLEARIDSQSCTHMTFPISRISAPGLQTLIDSSRHFLAVRISRSESSSICPTGYVSFKSPWKPGISNIIPCCGKMTHNISPS